MKIDLIRFQEKTDPSIQIQGELEEDSLTINSREISFVGPITYEGNIYKVDFDKFLHLDIDYAYKEACGRCLDVFKVEDSISLSGKLVEETDEPLSDLDEEEEETITYKNGKLDLRNIIMSTIILSLPMKPLCDRDCKGLCSKCGANHNREECECVIDNIDPRFEKLKNFFPGE